MSTFKSCLVGLCLPLPRMLFILLLVSPAVLAFTLQLRADTVAYWSFEEGVPNTVASGADSILDTSGNDLHGTPIGGPIYREVGGSVALELDGSNDHIFVSDDPLFELTQSLTIEALIRLDGNSANQQYIVFRGDNRGGLDPYTMNVAGDGRLRFQITSAANTGTTVKSLDPLPLGELLHIAGTLDDATGEMKLFINQQLVGSKTTSLRPFGSLVPTGNPGIGIGSRQSGSTDFFIGVIDDVRIHDVALAIPEPTTSALALAALCLAMGRRRIAAR